jgi:Zn-dependent peptidase ImmA (M78 family)
MEAIVALARSRIAVIEAAAGDTLAEAYGATPVTPPVDLNLVLQANGLRLQQVRFKDSPTAGYYIRADKTIFVNETDPYERQAFTLAHEIGHFILHSDMADEVWTRASEMALVDPADRPAEQEANWFASSLLMPREQLDQYSRLLRGLGSYVADLASAFGVSRLAMTYRLENVGMLEYAGR